MGARLVRAALLGALPFVSLTAVAAHRQVGAWLQGDSSIPNGVVIRDCANNQFFYARGALSNAEGQDLGGNSPGGCYAYEPTTGSTGWSLSDSTNCDGQDHHRGWLLECANGGVCTAVCAGLDPQGHKDSQCWDTNLNNNTCLTSCSVTKNVQYSTGSNTYSSCANRTITAFSVGQN